MGLELDDETAGVYSTIGGLLVAQAGQIPKAGDKVLFAGFEFTVLEVEDNGPGLAPADLVHVFERFWRASERPGGCGLGLAIVAAIAQRHGGAAAALPAQPLGLCIRLTLPLTAAGG